MSSGERSITVKSLNCGKTLVVDCSAKLTPLEVKEHLEQVTQIPVPQQCLLFQGSSLRDDTPMFLSGDGTSVKNGSVVHLIVNDPEKKHAWLHDGGDGGSVAKQQSKKNDDHDDAVPI